MSSQASQANTHTNRGVQILKVCSVSEKLSLPKISCFTVLFVLCSVLSAAGHIGATPVTDGSIFSVNVRTIGGTKLGH